ncbi:MAG TPA: hypothetical protein VFE53_14180 [Mucilaginibacter sp.]|jgi:hypothetical protein|nr:hypothetical protein [Mucilaginibacter sp.]
MIKSYRTLITILFAVIALGANAQSTATTSSPYSRYGIGTIDPILLPQTIGMGGIATAINRLSLYNNINPENPASYGFIGFTTIDAGINTNNMSLSQTGQPTNHNSDFKFSHVAFAIPLSKKSAVSFGLFPYSEMGYNTQVTKKGFGSSSPVDTNVTNYAYNGEGGLSKAYVGYGFGIGKHLYIGANASYIFGDLHQYSSVEIPTLYGMLNPTIEQSNVVAGVNYDYGVQYSFDFGEYSNEHLVLGYSAQANTSLNTTNTYIVSQFTYSGNTANVAADTVLNSQQSKAKIQLPQINHFGISFQNDGHFLVGADYTMGHWSSLSIAGVNQGLRDSKTFNIGGEYTPNPTALHSYFARTDYQLGFKYDESSLYLNNTNVKGYALTFGMGFPMAPANVGNSFYKINFAAEIGQTGTVASGLVRENYVTLHLNFVINDRWFLKFKFE